MFIRLSGSLSSVLIIILSFLVLTFNNCKTQKIYETTTAPSSNNSDTSGLQTANNSYSRVIAYPDTIIIIQPNETTLAIFLRGDERLKRTFTTDGYPILMNTEGFYEYGIADSESNFLCSGIRANGPEKRNKEEKRFFKRINKEIINV